MIIRTTVYDLDEIDRRIRLKPEILTRNGETILNLRAKFIKKKNNEQDEENMQTNVSQTRTLSTSIYSREKSKYFMIDQDYHKMRH